MNPINLKFTLTTLSALVIAGVCGCTTYVESPRPVVSEPPPREVSAPQPPPPSQPPYNVEVEVRSEQDFYEPLRSYGRWENVDGHGRCWIPDRVDREWRPYTNGHWQRTDAGWYWVSDEPWAWATYHYGRWDFHPSLGWYWVPEVQWAPSWVSWHEGGGYIGWAPLPPAVHFSGDRIDTRAQPVTPRAYVFVEQRQFLEPVRPTTVVNNTTIINKTVNITNIKIVNKTVINEGPRTEVIEQASGQRIQAIPARDERRRTEASVISRQRGTTDRTTNVQPPRNPNSRDSQISRAPTPQTETRINNAADSESRAHDLEMKARVEEQHRSAEAARLQADSARRAAEDQGRAKEEALRQSRIQEQQADLRAREAKASAEAQRRAQEVEAKSKLEADRRAKEADRQALSDAERRARTQERTSQAEEKRSAREKQAELDSQRRETNRLANPAADRRTRQQQAADERARRDASRRGIREPVPAGDQSLTNSGTPVPK